MSKRDSTAANLPGLQGLRASMAEDMDTHDEPCMGATQPTTAAPLPGYMMSSGLSPYLPFTSASSEVPQIPRGLLNLGTTFPPLHADENAPARSTR